MKVQRILQPSCLPFCLEDVDPIRRHSNLINQEGWFNPEIDPFRVTGFSLDGVPSHTLASRSQYIRPNDAQQRTQTEGNPGESTQTMPAPTGRFWNRT